MRRAALVALGGAAFAAASLPARAQAEAVRFGAAGVEESALPWYAQQKGFFADAGIDVALSTFANGGSITQGMLGGSIDVGVTNSGSMSSAHVRGLPLYLVACGALYSPASPIAHLVVDKTLGIRTAKDLSGRTIAVSTLRDMVQATGMEWIDRTGGDSRSVNFIELPTIEQDAAILAKRVDGSIMVEPIYSESKNDVQQMGLTYEAVNDRKPFQTLGIAANTDWVGRNPALARRLTAALHAAARWANDPRNHPEAVTLLTRWTKIDATVIAGYPRLLFAETNSPALLQPVIDLMARYAILPRSFPAAELFAPGIG